MQITSFCANNYKFASIRGIFFNLTKYLEQKYEATWINPTDTSLIWYSFEYFV